MRFEKIIWPYCETDAVSTDLASAEIAARICLSEDYVKTNKK